MSEISKFKQWLNDESYKPFILEQGQKTKTLILKIAKNDNFDYLFSQTFYHGSHIERDEHLSFIGMHCKKDNQVYCAYHQLKSMFPEFEESKGQYKMAEEVQQLVRQSIIDAVNSNPEIYSTIRPIDEQTQAYLDNFNERTVKGYARENFLAGISSENIEWECYYQFGGWHEDDLLEYILNPQEFVISERDKYLEENLQEILLGLREIESLREHIKAIEELDDSPIHRVKAIREAINKSSAQTARVTILKNDIEFSFKTSTDTLRRDPQYTYSRWDISSPDRREYEKLFGTESYKPEEVKEIAYRGQVIYSAEPLEPIETQVPNQTM